MTFTVRFEVPQIDIRVHLPNQSSGGELKELLVQLAAALSTFEGKAMAELDDLKAKVEANTAVDESAVTLLDGIKAKLDAAIASNDPAQLKALSDALGASNQRLAEAVTRNTPAETP